MGNDTRAIVIDNGSGTIKAGFAGEDTPKTVFNSVVGRPRETAGEPDAGQKNFYVGDETQSKLDILNLGYPIEQGVITNWDDMEKIWHHTLHTKLQVTPAEHPVLLTESPRNPKTNREKMAEVMFETFRAPALNISTQAVLSLFASCRTTGLVFDAGHSVSRAVPIHNNSVVSDAVVRIDTSGQGLTVYLAKTLAELGHFFKAPAELEVLRKVKEELCYVALDFDAEKGSAASNLDLKKQVQLPDGKAVILGDERFIVPEALFQPSRIGSEIGGITESSYNSILKCDTGLHRDLYSNVVLAGGTTLIPGLAERLQKELTELAPSGTQVKVDAPPERGYSAWLGGSKLAALPAFPQFCWSIKDYEESGASIVHRFS